MDTRSDLDLRTVNLGYSFTYHQLINLFKTIWGGVALPSKRPGFSVVVGVANERNVDDFDVILLDEFESFDMRELIRKCGVLDFKYHIKVNDYRRTDLVGRWVGDIKNDAAARFIQEMNDEKRKMAGAKRYFGLSQTTMLEMERPYQYILPQIKELLNPERRRLFLKDSKVLNYLSQIEETEIASLESGEFPAIEALYSVLELREYIRIQKAIASQPQQRHEEPKNILCRGMKIH